MNIQSDAVNKAGCSLIKSTLTLAMEFNSKKLFSIIIPNLNKESNLQALFESIFNNYKFNDFEIFFMDDGSFDRSLKIARQFPVQVFESAIRVGPSKLRNQASRLAKGEYLIFMDSDVVLFEDTLTNIREIVLNQERLIMTGLESLPCPIDNWIGTTKVLQIQEFLGPENKTSTLVEGWGSTFGIIRRDIFLNTGGFNEKYSGADIEDHELCLRMNMFPKYLEPKVRYRHSYPSFKEVLIKQFRRASLMAQLDHRVVFSNRAFFRMRYKIAHILNVMIFLSLFFSMFYHNEVIVLIVLFLFCIKFLFHHYLVVRAIENKGVFFAIYAILVNIILSLFVITGFTFGSLRYFINSRASK